MTDTTPPNARLEALSDGVFAIAMTLLIIDVKLPDTERIATTAELWHALAQLGPSVFAFLLSFGVILITWANHHATLKLVDRSSHSFILANGFLLLTVVAMPFPAELLGAFLWTDHAAPAVMLYNAVLALQAVGWILVGGAVLADHLTTGDAATASIRVNRKHGMFAFMLYSALALLALWIPFAAAIVTAGSWLFWLVFPTRMKHG